MKKRRFLIDRIIGLVIFFFVVFVLSSCQSKYAFLEYSVCKYPVWNADSTALAFVLLKDISKPPTEFGKIPDGGIHKFIYKNISLYYYDTVYRKNKEMVNFSEILNFVFLYNNNLKTFLMLSPNKLDYHFSKFKNFSNQVSEKYAEIERKYKNKFSINLTTKKIVIDSSFSEDMKEVDMKNREKYGFSKQIIGKIPLQSLGFDIKKIYPQSKRTYLNYIIFKRGNGLMRRAIWEQIIPSIKKAQVKRMIVLMDDYEAKLMDKDQSAFRNSSRLNNYENYLKETKKRLNKLL